MRTISRKEAIDDLRARFLELVDDDHCICEVAAREGIFCKGFAQWTFPELKERYAWMLKNRPRITRKELEELANRWQLARAYVVDKPIACDVQNEEIQHPTCSGWSTFTDEQLAGFYGEVFSEQVTIAEQSAAG